MSVLTEFRAIRSAGPAHARRTCGVERNDMAELMPEGWEPPADAVIVRGLDGEQVIDPSRDPVLVFRLDFRFPCLYCMEMTDHLIGQPEGVARCQHCAFEMPYKVVWADHPEAY